MLWNLVMVSWTNDDFSLSASIRFFAVECRCSLTFISFAQSFILSIGTYEGTFKIILSASFWINCSLLRWLSAAVMI